jgi:hypothetical protein
VRLQQKILSNESEMKKFMERELDREKLWLEFQNTNMNNTNMNKTMGKVSSSAQTTVLHSQKKKRLKWWVMIK